MRIKKTVLLLMALIMLVVMAPHGGTPLHASGEEAAGGFTIGSSGSEMIAGGGRVVSTSEETYFLGDSGGLMCGTQVLAEGKLSCLNVIENDAFFVRNDESGAKVVKLSLIDGTETEVVTVNGASVKEMYAVNGNDFYFLTDDGIAVYSGSESNWDTLQEGQNIFSFVPTTYGVLYATGALFHYDLHAAGEVIVTDVDDYYVDEQLNGGSLVFTKAGSTYQVTLQSLFSGDCVITDFTGYGTVETQELFSNLNDPDEEITQVARKAASGDAGAVRAENRKTLSQGVESIVRRAYQMTDIQWTPLANITGWNSKMTYYAGQTYTGLPYGQPVYASYVPWSTSLTDFIGAVNDPGSKMYTSQSTYNCVAPYYSCDCSAFVSWAWNLSSRQTTGSIPGFATLVSSSTYTGLQVGDCFCKRGSHVVLVTDITYDDSGAINGVEISESTVNPATNYCCQKTWYGTGYSYPLTTLQTRYIDNGYSLYRSTSRDSVTYTHCCAVPLEGDVCEACGANSYVTTKTYATIRFLSDTTIYRSPDDTSDQCGTVYSDQTLNITASTTIDDVIWYELETSGWVKANQTEFEGYLKTVTLTEEYLPSGRLVQGHVFPLEGKLTSSNSMTGITATISKSSGAQEQEKTVSLDDQPEYSLKNSVIDNAMAFGRVPLGDHILTLQITELAKCDGQDPELLTTVIRCPFSVYAVSEERTISARGIDVSKYQGDIDWDTVAGNVDFAIIRCGYGDDRTDQDDAKWNRNVEACERLGIPYGVYIYSYALTDEQALREAQHAIRLLEGHSPTLPVYLDLEDSGTVGTLTCASILRHTKIFCEAIEAAGYTPGVYASTSWWSGKLASGEYNRWNRWVARFSNSLNYNGELNVWQYSETGSVPGISGNVDLDYWYGDFPDSQPTHKHTYASAVTRDATCTEVGVCTYTCTTCGHQYMEEIPALSHAYGDWTAAIQPTCTKPGTACSACARCGDVQSRIVPPNGHTFQDGVCTACGLQAPQEMKLTISGPSGAAAPGTTITIPVMISGSADFADFALTVSSSEGLTLTKAEKGALLKNADGVFSANVSQRLLSWTGSSNIAGEGELMLLTFDVSESAAYESTLTISLGLKDHNSANFADAEETPVGVKFEEIAVTVQEHVHQYADVVTPPTCTGQGYTTHTCSCGDSYMDSSVPVLGHDWNTPTYAWAADNSSVTASRSCSRDESHVETETVNTTFEVMKEATSAEEGNVKFTAAFENAAFETQTRTVATPKLENPGAGLPCIGGEDCPGLVFTDMPAKGHWAHDAIDWAIVHEIAAGMSAGTFSPNAGCTRAQVVTFLWRAAGAPEPATSNNPFYDVKDGTYYYKAVLWAAENGITAGTSATTFSPAETCTRGQIVSFIWRFEGEPNATITTNPFTDVRAGAYYEKAVLWASETGVTAGTSSTTFSPVSTCTRAQVVTFLYRDLAN